VSLPADLRAQLAAVISPSHNAPHGYSDVQGASSSSPHDQNIDPAIGGPGGMMASGEGGDDGLDGRKGGKRELSNSKRAAQNRAAQVRFASLSSLCGRDGMCGRQDEVHDGVSLKKKSRWSRCFVNSHVIHPRASPNHHRAYIN
jgi:hypothetical protein